MFLIVRELPTTDIKTNKIYLVPNQDGQGNNVYIEYLYVENVWENLGEFKSEVDLSEYVDKLSFKEALEKHLQIMDTSAFEICMKNNIKLIIYNATDLNNIIKVCNGDTIGTIVEKYE